MQIILFLNSKVSFTIVICCNNCVVLRQLIKSIDSRWILASKAQDHKCTCDIHGRLSWIIHAKIFNLEIIRLLRCARFFMIIPRERLWKNNTTNLSQSCKYTARALFLSSLILQALGKHSVRLLASSKTVEIFHFFFIYIYFHY